jgi:hypothetical protein
MTDDDIPEEVARGVEKALFGRGAWKAPVVAVRRPRSLLRGKPSARQLQAEREAERPTYVADYEDGYGE